MFYKNFVVGIFKIITVDLSLSGRSALSTIPTRGRIVTLSARGIVLSANCCAKHKSQPKRNCTKHDKSSLAPKVDFA